MGEFNQGLCGCFTNTSLCCYAILAAPVAIGKNAESMGEKHPVLWVLGAGMVPCIAGGLLRGLIRKKFDIEGSFTGDCCTWMICGYCALVQETAQTKTMDYLLPVEPQQMKRVAPEQ